MRQLIINLALMGIAAVCANADTPATRTGIDTGGESCNSPDQAARRALEAAGREFIDSLTVRPGKMREYYGFIYRTAEGGYGYTLPMRGMRTRFPADTMLDGPGPFSLDGDNYVPHLRTGEVVVGAYHTHPPLPPRSDGIRYDHDHFSATDMYLAEWHNMYVYLRTPIPGDRLFRYDPSLYEPDNFYENRDRADALEPRDEHACVSSADSLGGAPSLTERFSAWLIGDPHITSHDGVTFDFQAAGEFVLVQSEDRDLVVQARFEPVPNNKAASITTAISLRAGGVRVGVYTTEPHVLLDGHDIRERFGGAPTGLLTLADDLRIELTDRQVEITGPRGDRFRVRFGSILDFYIGLAKDRRGKVSGLLGDYDGDRGNDFKTRGNAVVNIMGGGAQDYGKRLYRDWGDGWRVSAEESLFDYLPGRNSTSYDLREYPLETPTMEDILANPESTAAAERCGATGVAGQQWQNACVYDLVVSGDNRFTETYSDLASLQRQESHGQPPEQGFKLDTLLENPLFALFGDAAFADGVVHLTPSQPNRRGILLTNSAWRLDRGFTTEFMISIDAPEGSADLDRNRGGTGMAFVVSGRPGSNFDMQETIGFGLDQGDFHNLLSVELDTWRSAYDSSGNNVSINSVKANTESHLSESSTIPELSDGRLHRIRIDYEPGRFEVFVDDLAKPAISTSLTLGDHLQLSDGLAWIGFSAATRSAYEIHSVHSWSFAPK